MTIPEEYPTDISDEQLIELIKKYSKEATVAGRPSNYVIGPSYWKEMTELGQHEISNRIQKQLFTEIQNLKIEIKLLKDDNKKSGIINQILSFFTIFLAVITGVIGYLTLDYSKSSQDYDVKWKNSVIEELKNQNKNFNYFSTKNTVNDSIKSRLKPYSKKFK